MPRGFASLSPERRKEMARRGAARLHQAKRNHKFTPEEAREAAKKRHGTELLPANTRLINIGANTEPRMETTIGTDEHQT